MTDRDKIVIIGAGTVGRYLSELLEEEKQEVVVIDMNKDALEKIGDSLDVQTLLGNGADPSILKTAGVAEAHLFLALTSSDEVNLLASFTAKQMGAVTCVARARSPWCLDNSVMNLRDRLGIDLIMNPEHLMALEIIHFLDHPDTLAVHRFAHGKIQLRTFIVDAKSKFAGKKLKECPLPEGVIVAVRSHDGEAIIPNGETELRAGDKLTVMGLSEHIAETQKLFHAATEKVRNVTIAGGGNTGLFLAETLEKRHFDVKLMELDKDRCQYLSERLDHTQVVFGDATDIGIMKEERISASDVFVAVTGDDENNLMSCLLAKELGVPQTVVNITRPDYASLVQKFGIDLALSPRHVMGERILTLISWGRIQALTLLEDGKIEVIELVAQYGSSMIGKPLSRLSIPDGALITAIVHLGETIVPRGHHQILPGDTVIAVGLREAIDRLEEKFRGD